jgi:hypothetical protein
VVTNNAVQYTMSRVVLVITQGATAVSNESMIEYWAGNDW